MWVLPWTRIESKLDYLINLIGAQSAKQEKLQMATQAEIDALNAAITENTSETASAASLRASGDLAIASTEFLSRSRPASPSLAPTRYPAANPIMVSMVPPAHIVSTFHGVRGIA